MNGSPPSMLLDDQLCFALYSTSLKIQSLYRPLLKQHDLTYPQYLVLLVLWEQDGVPVSQIGARLGLDSATLTPLLKRLEGRAVVERHRSAADERKVLVSLTPAGHLLRADIEQVTTSVTCSAVEAADDADALLRSLVQLRDAL